MTRRTALILALAVACGPKAPPVSAGAPEPVSAPAPLPAQVKTIPVAERIDKAAELIAAEPPSEVSLQQAIQLLESAKADEPGNAVAHLNLGIANHRLGKLDVAARSYQAVIGIQPENGAAYLYLGEIAREQGNNDGAVTNFRNGLRVDVDNMALWAALVAVLRESGRLDEAVEEGKNALAENANSIEVYNNLGLVYLDQKEYVLAKFVFQKALMVQGAESNAMLNTNLGWTYYLEGDPAKAQYRLEEARKLEPTLVPTLLYLAHLYMDDHNWEDALGVLEVAAKQEPGDATIQQNLGICYRGVGRNDEARKAYEKALALSPQDPAPLFNLGVLLGDTLKEYDASMASFQQYIDKGGTQRELAAQYIDEVDKEKKRVEKRRKADEERKTREQERVERQKLLEEAEKRQKAAGEGETAPPADGAPTPEGGTPAPGSDTPAPAEAPKAPELPDLDAPPPPPPPPPPDFDPWAEEEPE